MKELAKIQQALKVPKSQRNNFGKYNYRSCEDILQAVKPHLGECVLTLSDRIQVIGERVYVVATAEITDPEGQKISVQGFARESLAKKGMDEAQITGSCSSYARKYALNGLLLIDESQADPDHDAQHQEQGSETKK